MYSRTLTRQKRGAPPPGYAGTVFGQSSRPEEPMEGKRHSPEEFVRDGRISHSPPAGGEDRAEEKDPRDLPFRSVQPEGPMERRGGLWELVRDFRGKIDEEDLILLLVLLLMASSDSAGAETLLLGLLLLAGKG